MFVLCGSFVALFWHTPCCRSDFKCRITPFFILSKFHLLLELPGFVWKDILSLYLFVRGVRTDKSWCISLRFVDCDTWVEYECVCARSFSLHWLIQIWWSTADTADKASGEGELSDRLCEIADASASFKSDRWKHFGFLVSKNEKEKVTDGQRIKQYTDTVGR